jgi:hypothetical protein
VQSAVYSVVVTTPAVVKRLADKGLNDVIGMFRWRQTLRDAILPKIKVLKDAADQQRFIR